MQAKVAQQQQLQRSGLPMLDEPPVCSSTSGHHSQRSRHVSFDAGYAYVQHKAASATATLSLHSSSCNSEPDILAQRLAAAAAAEAEAGRPAAAAAAAAGQIHSSSAGNSKPDLEIGWVWPPCLASDAGPVEFAVNVAPAEWLNSRAKRRNLMRVPCWPLQDVALHITHGEQLLQAVDVDICGTTKVRLQLPPALTSAQELNFLTVMIVSEGCVGPATQLLTMPMAAADEFCGLFNNLVETEMLPKTAAHPEFVSLLFGSCSDCSSNDTQMSCGSAAAEGNLAAAGGWIQQQQLQQQQRGQQYRPHRRSVPLCLAGRPQVVKTWADQITPAAAAQAAVSDVAATAAAAAASSSSLGQQRVSDSDADLAGLGPTIHTAAAAAAAVGPSSTNVATTQQPDLLLTTADCGQSPPPAAAAVRPLVRHSFDSSSRSSLDRCAVHVHNEMDRAQKARHRLSIDESALCAIPAAAADIAPAVDLGASDSCRSSYETEQTGSTNPLIVPGSSGCQLCKDTPLAAAAAVPRLERRSAVEATMAAAFTAAWTRHMLELASDLQYLVVCVPWAFAGRLETWFSRIVSHRASSDSSASSFLAPPTSGPTHSESSWDSSMYIRRLGHVLDCLERNNMWMTMSLLLQHCWQGGLDFYPAGRLYQHLAFQQQPAEQGAGISLMQPLDIDLLTAEYLQHLSSIDVGPASGWMRPVPTDADVDTASSSSSSIRQSFSISRHSGLPGVAASRRSSTDIAAAVASAAMNRRRSADCARGSRRSGDGAQQRRRRSRSSREQEAGSRSRSSGHGAPRRSFSWPLGVLYCALTWAQSAQRKHRRRTIWQRAWQLHTLTEESERDSTSTAGTSSFSTYRSSSSSTNRSSGLSFSAPLPNLTSNPAGAAAAALFVAADRVKAGAAAAAENTQLLARYTASAGVSAAVGSEWQQWQQWSQPQSDLKPLPPRCGSNSSSSFGSSRAFQQQKQKKQNQYEAWLSGTSDSTTAAVAASANPSSRSNSSADARPGLSVQAAIASEGSGSSSNSSANLSVLQSGLFAPASLPKAKITQLQAGLLAQAKLPVASQRQQQQQPVQQMQQDQAPKISNESSKGDTGLQLDEHGSQQQGSSSDSSSRSDSSSSQPHERQASEQAAPDSPANGNAAAATVVAAAAEVTAAADDSTFASKAMVIVSTVSSDNIYQAPGSIDNDAAAAAALAGIQPEQQGMDLVAAAALSTVAAANHIRTPAAEAGSTFASAIKAASCAEQYASQLLLLLMILYCFCFLPSIFPGQQPDYLLRAMQQRPAWSTMLLLVLLLIHMVTSTAAAAAATVPTPRATATADGAAAAARNSRSERQKQRHRRRLAQQQQQQLLRSVVSSVAVTTAAAIVCWNLWAFWGACTQAVTSR